MPRKKTHDQVTTPLAPRVAEPQLEPVRPEETEQPSSGHEEETLFEDFDDYCKPEVVSSNNSLGLGNIPALDADLTPADKKIFVDLIRKEMPLAERARRLAELARFKDTKRAAVSLRAIIEMNLLDDMRKEQPNEDKPMFLLPEESKVSIKTEEPAK
jgi:hypothetical protein